MSPILIGGFVFLLLLASLAVLPLFIWAKRSMFNNTQTTITAGGGASTTSTTSKVRWLKMPSQSPLFLYGVILVVMALILVWGPTTWIGAIGNLYQTIAITMILVGLFLLATSSGKRFLVALMMLAFVILAFNKPASIAEQIQTAKSEGIGSITKPRPLTPEEQAARAAILKQEAELRIAQAATEAAARAKAAEAERLTTSVSENLPQKVRVPLCGNGTTWSDIIEIPPGWDIAWGWTGRYVTTQFLRDAEEWEAATTAFIEGDVIAVRFCTTATSRASLPAGMPLTWAPR